MSNPPSHHSSSSLRLRRNTRAMLPKRVLARATLQRPVAGMAAALIAMTGLPLILSQSAAFAASCPPNTTAVPFTWQGAGNGNQAVWAGGDNGYTQAYTVGTGATQVQMTMAMVDPLNRNADANHRFTTAPYAGLNLFSSLSGIYTKSNGAYGAGWLTFGIGTISSGEGSTLNLSFNRPVVIRDFVVGDIDFSGYSTTVNNEPEQSYQDQVEVRTKRGSADIPFTVSPLSPGATTTTGQTVSANYKVGVKGDLNPADPLGAVAINTSDPVNSFAVSYTNGAADAAGEAGRNNKPYVPAGTTGMSDGQAIRISGFTICVGNVSVGDTVFKDVDGDGTQDPAEGGVANVTMLLKDTLGNVMATAVTDANGKYVFPALPPFTYVVEVDKSTLPAGMGPVPTGDPDPVKDAKSTVVITGTTPTTVGNIDFGFVPTRIAGTVHEDTNNDGVLTSGEPGIKTVTIELVNAANVVVATTTTAADGTYEFVGFAPGTYTVREVQPAGYLDGQEDPGTLGATSTVSDRIVVSVGAGEQSVDNNFGELKTSSISGKVYVDKDNNGVVDAGEKSLGGVTVELFDSNAVLVATTQTAPDGTYSFAGINPGIYSVRETQPAYLDGIDSPGSGTTSTTTNDRITVSLASGESSTGNNFGERGASIAGVVFADNTNPGTLDGSDPRISGVTVQLFNSSGTLIAIATSDSNGAYLFDNLPAGSYTVKELQPSGYADGIDLPGSGGTAQSTTVNDQIAVQLAAGENSVQNNFGEVLGTISGSVWNDNDNDGTINGAETNIAGVQVKLLNAAGVIVATATTDSSGNYSFTGLAPGDYRVVETQPAAYTDGKEAPGTGTTSSAVNDQIAVSLAAGSMTSTGNNFGERTPGTASISGAVFLDSTPNGYRALGDPGIAGVTVKLLDSLGNVVATTVTDSLGGYSFTGLFPGTYSVTETQPSGYTDGLDMRDNVLGGPTSPLPDTHAGIVLTIGQAVTLVNFGETPPAASPATISGTVYVDADDDGFIGVGEGKLEGVVINLYDNISNEFVSTTTTDASGNYSFGSIAAGTYRVEQVQPAGFVDGKDTAGTGTGTTSASGVNDQFVVTVGANRTSAGNNFGEGPGSISGKVYADADNSGTQAASGEPGIAGVTVQLLDSTGAIVATQTTVANGSYTFKDLKAGNYTVVEVQPSAWIDGQDQAGTGATLASNDRITVVLPAGGASTANNFGELGATVSGTVYVDTDVSGSLNTGDTGLGSVTVKLFNSTNTEIASATSDPTTGAYEFKNVPAGNYTVVQTQPTTHLDRSETAGPFATLGTNDVIAIALPAGGNSPSNNFGESVKLTGSISGKVYADANVDGGLTSGEPGIAGVSVQLLDSTGGVITTVQTNSLGEYSFPGLDAGTYSVRQIQPSGWADASETVGTGTAVAGSLLANDRISVVLGNGENSASNNFGEVGARISGAVFSERDNDGLKEVGEDPIANVTVQLFGAGNVLVATTTTDEFGAYSFANLPAGTYTIVETQPGTHTDGKEAPGTGGATTSANDRITVTVAANGTSAANNFAEIPPTIAPVSISGTVYIDSGRDGSLQIPEARISGLTITLLDIDGNVVSTTTTDSNGAYQFVDLLAGTYTVVETQPVGYGDGTETSGTGGSLASGNDRFTVTLAPGQASVGNNFGELPAQISGFVYFDGDSSASKTSGDTPIVGTTVTLYDSNNAVVASTSTGADGSYQFDNLVAGTYRVVETQPAAYRDGTETPGSGITSSTLNDAIAVSLPGGSVSTGNNFGELALANGTISGFVYRDDDTSGIRSVGDPGIATTVTLLDGNGNTIATTTTNPTTGAYSFTGLPAGNYTVVETQPSGLLDSVDNPGPGAYLPSSTNDRIAVSLATGTSTSTDNNFGELPPAAIPAAIRGRVFVDSDRAGDRNPSDPGIGGVTVQLLNSGGTEVSRTTTAADGTYSFTGLPAGTYSVVELQPAAWGDGADLPGSGATLTSNDRLSVTVVAGDNSTANDFAEFGGTISGQTFVDLDNTGGRTTGEPAISGTVVKLIDSTGAVVATTPTLADGSYRFENLPAGNYRVEETQPSAFEDGKEYPGTGTAASPSNDVISVSLPVAGSSTGNNFAELNAPATGSISGVVYNDANNDGDLTSEPRISGAAVQLLDSTGAVVASTTTGADGTYVFSNLPAGSYTIVETQPAAWNDGKETPGTGSTATTVNDRISVTIPAAGSSTGNNFGEIAPPVVPGSITGFVYVDAANDGARSGDAPISAVTITLYRSDGSVGATTTTGTDGSYRFDNVAPGTYRVVESQPSTHLDGVDSAGNAAVLGSTNDTIVVTLSAGLTSAENNFGERPPAALPGTISGSVFKEVGIQPQAPLTGVVVRLLDASGTEVSRTTTAANGTYSFTGLPAGVYTVAEEQPTTHPDGPEIPGTLGATSTVNDRISVTLPAGGTSVDNNFSEREPLAGTGTVSGTVFGDADNDGVKDAASSTASADPGISAVTVRLLDPSGNVVATTTTDADGNYSFANVPAGTFRITQSQPTGWTDGIDTPGAGATIFANDVIEVVMPPGGATFTGNNFAEIGALITGSVYVDLNDDGLIGSAETLIAGTTVDLLDANGQKVATTTTKADGTYSFGPVSAGTYTVVESQPAAYSDGRETPGTGAVAGTVNDQLVVTAVAGQTSSGNNFGEKPKDPPSLVAGTVYRDRTRDGVLSKGDPGVEGVTVKLLDSSGNIVATAVTSPSGRYEFPEVPAGTYTIVEEQPDLYDDGSETPGNATVVRGNDLLTVTLAGGQTSDGNNFGELAKPGTIGGRVWVDLDDDGVIDDLDPKEVPLSSVTIQLQDLAGNIIATTTTGPDGTYQFLNVTPGQYKVVELQPANALDGKDIPGIGNNSPGNDVIFVNLADSGSSVDNDFAELASLSLTTPGQISGTVVIDTNGNGKADPSETPIAGVVVELLNPTTGAVVATTTTAGDGTYLFRNVLPGEYLVREVQPTLYGDGLDTAGTFASANGNDNHRVNLPAGSWSSGNDFGELSLGRIAGSVVVDTNGDGHASPGESAIEGVIIQLVNPATGAVIATTLTKTDGSYEFTSVPPGDYLVREIQPGLVLDGTDGPGNGAARSGNDAHRVTLVAGVSSVGNDFGEQLIPVVQVLPDTPAPAPVPAVEPTPPQQPAAPAPASAPAPETAAAPTPPPAPTDAPAPSPTPAQRVSGKVWLDNNRDQTNSTQESGVGSVELRIRNAAGEIVATVRTDASGNWSADLVPGDYELEPVLPEGFDPTTITRVKFTVVKGVNIETPPIGVAASPVLGELALTGSDLRHEGETGLLLIAGGAAIVAAASRKRRFRLGRR